MNYQHRSLAAGRWKNLPLATQIANIGSEILRADRWKQKGNTRYAELAFFRALELLDLSLQTKRTLPQLRELARLRECVVDYFAGDNVYGSTSKTWHSYILPFTVLSRGL